jgi:hypothetical protein
LDRVQIPTNPEDLAIWPPVECWEYHYKKSKEHKCTKKTCQSMAEKALQEMQKEMPIIKQEEVKKLKKEEKNM